jgi:uncharacterized cupin superfamily protein
MTNLLRVEPGRELGTHEDSPEELIVCLEGDEIEAQARDAEGEIGSGEPVVIPPMAPHGCRNVGDKTARFLGYSRIARPYRCSKPNSNRSAFETSRHSVGTRSLRTAVPHFKDDTMTGHD